MERYKDNDKPEGNGDDGEGKEVVELVREGLVLGFPPLLLAQS